MCSTGASLSLSLSLSPLTGLIQEFDYFASHDLDCAEDTESATVSFQAIPTVQAYCFVNLL